MTSWNNINSFKHFYLPVYTYYIFCRYLDRIIRQTDLQEFSALLEPHQKAVTSDGWYQIQIKPSQAYYFFKRLLLTV